MPLHDDVVRIRVSHRRGSRPAAITRIDYQIPEGIDPDHVDEFIAAMIHTTAAEHVEHEFGFPDPRLVDAVLRNVLTALLETAKQRVQNRRLAERVLDVLRLDDGELLERFRAWRGGGVDG